jgi:hypothetical protein
MNIERLTTIVEWLEAGAPGRDGVAGFDMSEVSKETDCGTVCCICGAAVHWWGSTPAPEDYDGDVSMIGQFTLGLDFKNADALFAPPGFIDSGKYTTAHAARCIRKLIATGAVDWEGTRTP